MLTKVRFWLVIVFALMLFTACKKNYLERFPLNGPSSATFYSNEAELKMGLIGCYKSLNFPVKGNRPWVIITDVTTDIDWNRSNSAIQDIGNGSFDSQNAAIENYWEGFYKGIGRCNFLLANIDKLKGKVDSSVLIQSAAEVRFLRAVNYLYLNEFFGGVPLITKPQTLEDDQVARSTKEEVADFVISELADVAKILPLSRADDQQHGRATKGAALAMEARSALYNQKWDIAGEAAKEVMDLGVYKLDPDFRKLFMYSGQSSAEIILSLQYLKGVLTQDTPNYFGSRLAGGVSNEVPPQSMIDSYECTDGLTIDKSPLFDPQHPFENRDPRLAASIVLPGSIYFNFQFETNPDSLKVWNYNMSPAIRISNSDATSPYATFSGYLWRKYTDIQDMADDGNSEINLILIRYAEVLLTYAEAKIEANQIDESVYDAINQVRERPSVNMPPIEPGKTQAELRSIVRMERKVELAVEGLRLFDIRRWKIAERVMNGPLLGRIRTEFLSNAPVIDENGTADYSKVSNSSKMRVIEIRRFNPARDYVWPIPNIDILTNKKLIQNPNY